MRIQPKQYRGHVLPINLHLVLASEKPQRTLKDLIKVGIDGMTEDDFSEAAGATTYGFGKTTHSCIIFWSEEYITPAVAAHEAVHVAHEVLPALGVPTDPDHDETMAYMVQWVVDRVGEWSGRW